MSSESRAGAAAVRTCVVCRRRYSRNRMCVLNGGTPDGLGVFGPESVSRRSRKRAYVCGNPGCCADRGVAARASHELGRAWEPMS